jgi:hypothetical protein
MENLAAWLMADKISRIETYLRAHGARLETLQWSPTVTEMMSKPIRFLVEYWHSLKADRGIPKASDISPFDLKPALGHVVLIDMLDDGWNGRFRLYGTKVAETYGRDMTGRCVSDIDGGNYMSVFFRALYRVAWLRQEAFFSLHYPPPHVSVESWQRLALPLCGPDGKVSRFLACNTAGRWRAPVQKMANTSA